MSPSLRADTFFFKIIVCVCVRCFATSLHCWSAPTEGSSFSCKNVSTEGRIIHWLRKVLKNKVPDPPGRGKVGLRPVFFATIDSHAAQSLPAALYSWFSGYFDGRLSEARQGHQSQLSISLPFSSFKKKEKIGFRRDATGRPEDSARAAVAS